MYICEHMTPDPLTITAETSLVEARKILDDYKFRHLPVVDLAGELLGIVTDRDLRSAYPSSVGKLEDRQLCLESLAKTSVATIMTKACTTLGMDETLDDALFLFDRDKVGGLPVVNGKNVVLGMFSIRDLMRAYKNLFGVSDKGSVLIGLEDTGEVGIMGKIVSLLEDNGILFTRLIRLQDPDTSDKIYLRINTFRLSGVYKLFKQHGLTIIKP
ncbi:MAG: CBS domain-containing protein [Desulfotalea sp.]